MAKSKAHEKLLSLLLGFKAGDITTQEFLMKHMGWTKKTLKTYESKQMIAPFLQRIDDASFKAVKNGLDIKGADIVAVFSQAKPKKLHFMKGTQISASKGRYLLEKKIGEGAVGHVWEANCPDNGSSYAAKILSPREDLLDPSKIENVTIRFRREAKNGRKLSHPNVITYHDDGEVNGTPFIIMELASCSLGNVIENKGQFGTDDSIEVVRACLNGLIYLHGHGCVHRDIKPTNILYIKGQYVIGDLGIVQWSDLNPAFTSAGAVTRASVQLGSWFYMAPEQFKNPSQIDGMADIYALGVSWYEILTMNTPSPAEIGAKKYSQPTGEDKLNRLLDSMLNFSSGDRPTATEVLEAIDNF